MINKTRLYEKQLVNLIKDSQSSDISELKAAKNINCYAFALDLTYPDKLKSIYTPGMIHNIEYDYGSIITNSTNLKLIEHCLFLDCKTLNKKIKKVSFNDIKDNDNFSYIGICKISYVFSLSKESLLITKKYNTNSSWHFIKRTKNNQWIHKPNWIQDSEIIVWEKKGKLFTFNCATTIPNYKILVKCKCKNNYYYRIEN